MVGRIHSIQSLGALDGPGLRTVIFMQGCPLQCIFCHSVDTTPYSAGEEIGVDELLKKIIKNKPYWKNYGKSSNHISGGVTITGGDPTAQPVFLEDLLRELKNEGIHVAIDTSLFTSKEVLNMLLPYVDLWMVSIKSMDEEEHLKLTGRPNTPILENLRYLDKQISEKNLESKVRIRYVVIPTVTDEENHAKLMGKMISKLENLESVELLPYVTMGRFKWIELFGKYQLEGIPEATKEDMDVYKGYLSEYNLEILG